MILERILAAERRLQFAIVEEGIPLTGKKTTQHKSKKSKRKDGAKPKFKPPKKLGKRGKRR